MGKACSVCFAMIAIAFAHNSHAQGLPATDIWLINIEAGVPGDPVKISSAKGYNNQPHFSTDGTVIYYTRERPDDASAVQTDIAAFHTTTSTTTSVNNTSESEYSPTPIPGCNSLSVIQVGADQAQRLWAINAVSGRMHLLFPDIQPVGYHTWINDTEVAMFILGDSFTLQTATLNQAGTRLIADNIGRTLRTHPVTNEILFVDKNREPWQIAAYDVQTATTRPVMPLFPASEDFTIDSNGNYWSGNGSKLYKRSPRDKRWMLMADYQASGIHHISRLAIHLDSAQIALVSD